MPSPYSGFYPLISPREKMRLYEIIERCGSMGMGIPTWFDDEYNGIIESMPPNIFMKLLDSLVLEGNLHFSMTQSNSTFEIREEQRMRKETGDAYPVDKTFGDAFIPSPPTRAGMIQNIGEDLLEATKCYQDAVKIRRNVIPRYKKWYARDYGPYRPLRDKDLEEAVLMSKERNWSEDPYGVVGLAE